MICWAFGSLMFAIMAIRVMRGFRKASDLRARRIPLGLPIEKRRPSDEFHDQTWLPLCERIDTAARTKLLRPLSAAECRTIWRSRSPLVLEVVLNEIGSAGTADEVAALLKALPPGMDRPDLTAWVDRASHPIPRHLAED